MEDPCLGKETAMKLLDLEGMREYCGKATEGPWDWEYGVSQRTAWALMAGRKYIFRFEGPNDITICPAPEDDMDFITAARTDFPALITGYEQLREAIELHCVYCYPGAATIDCPSDCPLLPYRPEVSE
jgi:hypothetical protein